MSPYRFLPTLVLAASARGNRISRVPGKNARMIRVLRGKENNVGQVPVGAYPPRDVTIPVFVW